MPIDPHDKTEPDIALGDLSVIDEAPRRAAGARRPRRAQKILAGLLALTLAGALSLGLAFVLIARDLPTIRSLNDYHPKQATVVFGKDGQVVARFASERRTVVSYDRIPPVMVDSVIASEDADFFTHQGVDYLGILRCFLKSVVSGRAVCGGSTITQQTVKTFLLTPEKRLSRKLKELILAKRVEEALSKHDILYLYLNQIYFGHGAYGVQEAARVYFGKDVSNLTVEEAALLAGLPQSPNRLDPYRYPERAMRRRAYVLRRLRELGKIDARTHDLAAATPIRVDWRVAEGDLDNNNHYAAHIRKLLEEIPGIGVEGAQDGGLRVYVGIEPSWQRAAEKAVRDGLRALDKRQGWRGPLLHLEPDELTRAREALQARLATASPSIAELEGGAAYQPVIWDLSRADGRQRDGRLDVDALVHQARFRRLTLERIVGGLVVELDEPGKAARVALAPEVVVTLPLRSALTWARRYDLARITSRPRTVGEVLKKGDVVLVRPTSIGPASAEHPAGEIVAMLEQTPRVEAALVAIEPASRQVRALVGGFGTGAGAFNRATQASRQAGSTFKPFVYGSALGSGHFNTLSTCLDRPHVYRDPWTGESWKPQNYDGHFDGEITLRTALTKSKNLCSVWLIHEVGLDAVVDLAHRAGIHAEMPKSDTLALGSATLQPLELINAYATLASGGRYADPVFIQKVVDPSGKVLFESQATPRQTITPELTYLITSLMQSVVEDGTAQAVKALERPVAGKTGTTNESRDAWFIGFTPDLVAGVWVGFDDNSPLGVGESGGRAAIPIWLDFMREATKDLEVRDFVAPPGIVFAHVDPKSGLLAPSDYPGVAYEPFVAGSEPTEFVTNAVPPTNFGLDDYER